MRGNRSLISRFLFVAVALAASVFCVSAQNSHGIDINQRPLRDFGDELKRDVDSKTIDPSGPFLVEFRGRFDDKGKIDIKSSSFTRSEGDAALVKVVKKGILAIADAGYFGYLQQLKAKDLELVVEQTETTFSTKVLVNQPTENVAKTFAAGFNMFLQLLIAQKNVPNATETQKNDAALLKFAKVRAAGSNVIFSFVAPAAEIQSLVAEKLAEHSNNGR